MSVADFLFEGQSPPASSTYGSNVSNMPRWMSDYANSILSGAAGVGSEGYQPYTGPRLAGLTPDQKSAFDLTRSTVNNTPGPLTLAKPYLDQAGKTFTGSTVSDYMNPYMSNVTDRAASLAGRAMNEQLLPALESKFGTYGQDARSSAFRAEADRGTRDIAENLNQQNLAALSQGYQQAGAQFTSDAGRNAQLVSAMGPLAQYAQQQGITGAAALDTIGKEQQQDTQNSYDLAYGDFQNQRDYPKTQLSWMQSLLNGTPYDRATSGSISAPGNNFAPSGLSQLAGGAATIGGLMNLFKGMNMNANGPVDPAGMVARGGYIRTRPRFRMGGPLRIAYAA